MNHKESKISKNVCIVFLYFVFLGFVFSFVFFLRVFFCSFDQKYKNKSLKIQPRHTIRLLYFLYFHVEFVRCFCILYFPVFGVLSCFVICDLKSLFLGRRTTLPNHLDTLPSIHPSTHLVNGFGLAVPRSNTALALLEKRRPYLP